MLTSRAISAVAGLLVRSRCNAAVCTSYIYIYSTSGRHTPVLCRDYSRTPTSRGIRRAGETSHLFPSLPLFCHFFFFFPFFPFLPSPISRPLTVWQFGTAGVEEVTIMLLNFRYLQRWGTDVAN